MPPQLKQLLGKLHGSTSHAAGPTTKSRAEAESLLLFLRSQAAESSVGCVQELLLGSKATQLLRQKKENVQIRLRELRELLSQREQ
jgi:uncharacterized protein involved in exopolysaccharide biosynthesis